MRKFLRLNEKVVIKLGYVQSIRVVCVSDVAGNVAWILLINLPGNNQIKLYGKDEETCQEMFEKLWGVVIGEKSLTSDQRKKGLFWKEPEEEIKKEEEDNDDKGGHMEFRCAGKLCHGRCTCTAVDWLDAVARENEKEKEEEEEELSAEDAAKWIKSDQKTREKKRHEEETKKLQESAREIEEKRRREFLYRSQSYSKELAEEAARNQKSPVYWYLLRGLLQKDEYDLLLKKVKEEQLLQKDDYDLLLKKLKKEQEKE